MKIKSRATRDVTVMCSIICHLGFLLEKKVGVNQPKRLENARILIANTAMDTDKIKVFGSKVSDGQILM